MGGGASAGIYEFLHQFPKDKYRAYAIIPPDSEAKLKTIEPLFEDIHIRKLAWWNVRTNLDIGRRVMRRISAWRHGVTTSADKRVIAEYIDRWNIDLVHSGTAMTLSGALAANAKGIPHIWHIKEAIGSDYRVQFSMPDHELAAYMSSLSTYIVTMSDYIAEFFRAHNVKNLVVIPDGVDLNSIDDNQERRLRHLLDIDDDTLLVGMVASFVSKWKKQDVFIKMAGILAESHPDIHFLIIGGKPDLKARWPNDANKVYYLGLEALARELIPEGRITFKDHYPNPTDIMRSLDILVHPCDVEPFGRIAIEAMSVGTPVIGPTRGGISETVLHEQTGLLVNPDDPQAFAEAVVRLKTDDILYNALSKQGQRRVMGMYSVAQMIVELDCLYQDALNSANSIHETDNMTS